jgi:protein-S-isoprenylcysteine O-methyltransferase Ste14
MTSTHASRDDQSPAAGDRLPQPRPRSATGALTGLAGLAAAVVAIVVLQHWLQPGWMKALVLATATALAMVAVEIGWYRTHRNPTTGLANAPLRPAAPLRIAHKLIGFWSTMGVAAVVYSTLPEYADTFYEPFRAAALWALPGIAIASPFYIAWVDRRQRDPYDAYAQLGQLLTGLGRPASWTPLLSHARGWVVKAFFLPLMFVYLEGALVRLWSLDALPLDRFDLLFPLLIDSLYLVDVLVACVGYSLTLRAIDTHIRTVEPTAFGWMVCLVCYQPFWGALVGSYFAHERDGLEWTHLFAPWPALYLVWGLAILVLIAVYVWATLAFGLRFSNLTNRGIITNGPYRWTKHPAYICKCISFWMIALPFVPGAGWAVAAQSCLLIVAGNLLYVFRARTEERHLMQDPAYRDYAAWIAQHGLIARISRAYRPR